MCKILNPIRVKDESTATHCIANFIWGFADDVLRDNYVGGKYRNVILPMTVIICLDALLKPTKEAILKMKQQLNTVGIANQNAPHLYFI